MRDFFFAALMLGVAAAGCARDGDQGDLRASRPSTVVEAETRVDAVPQEEPAVARTQWRAVNDTTRSIAGNLRVSLEGARGGPIILAFANGVTIRAQPYNVVPADSRSGVGGQSFAALLSGDPRVDAYLYRVVTEQLIPQRQAGLCGAVRTRYLAVSEFVDGSGHWVFKIAAFRGEGAPPAGSDTELCESYAFTAQ